MTILVVRVLVGDDDEPKGLKHGRIVPLNRATIHPHPSNAQNAIEGFRRKIAAMGATPPAMAAIPWRVAKEIMP